MKQFLSAAVLIVVAVAFVFCKDTSEAKAAKAATPALTLGTVSLPKSVILANGVRLEPGTYDVRLTAEESRPATGLIPGRERWAEFVWHGTFLKERGKAVGHEIANVVLAADVGKIPDQDKGVPAMGKHAVEITPHDFLRIWFNKGGTQYLIYLRLAGG